MYCKSCKYVRALASDEYNDSMSICPINEVAPSPNGLIKRVLPVLFQCTNERFVYGYGEDDVPKDAALIENDCHWGWFVGPDFGCIHFEQMD